MENFLGVRASCTGENSQVQGASPMAAMTVALTATRAGSDLDSVPVLGLSRLSGPVRAVLGLLDNGSGYRESGKWPRLNCWSSFSSCSPGPPTPLWP